MSSFKIIITGITLISVLLSNIAVNAQSLRGSLNADTDAIVSPGGDTYDSTTTTEAPTESLYPSSAPSEYPYSNSDQGFGSLADDDLNNDSNAPILFGSQMTTTQWSKDCSMSQDNKHQCKSEDYYHCPGKQATEHLNVGPDPKIESNHEWNKYEWIATPHVMTNDLYQMNKVWGGVHITLGHSSIDEHSSTKLHSIEHRLKGGIFDTKKNFHLSKDDSSDGKPHVCTTHYIGWHLLVHSATLTEVIKILKEENACDKCSSPSKLHASTVTSGHLDSFDKIKHVLLNKNVVWDLALVKVKHHDGNTYIKREHTMPIYHKKNYHHDHSF